MLACHGGAVFAACAGPVSVRHDMLNGFLPPNKFCNTGQHKCDCFSDLVPDTSNLTEQVAHAVASADETETPIEGFRGRRD